MDAADAISVIISIFAAGIAVVSLVYSRKDRRKDEFGSALDRAAQARKIEITGGERTPQRSHVLTGPKETAYGFYTHVSVHNDSDESIANVVMIYPSRVIVPKTMPPAKVGTEPGFDPEFDTKPRADQPRLTLPDGSQRTFTAQEISRQSLSLPNLRAGESVELMTWIDNPGPSTPFEPELRFNAANGRRYRREFGHAPEEI